LFSVDPALSGTGTPENNKKHAMRVHYLYLVAMMPACFCQSFTGLMIDLLFDNSAK